MSSGRGLLPILPPGRPLSGRLASTRLLSVRLFSARPAVLVEGALRTDDEVLRTDELLPLSSSEVTFLPADVDAGWRVVVWRPTVVVLSEAGV